MATTNVIPFPRPDHSPLLTRFLDCAKEKKLKIVVLPCPYRTLGQTRVRELFPRILDFKIKGYQENFPDGVLPLDTYDFVADHILVVTDDGGPEEVLLAFKMIDSQTCSHFRLHFPAEHVLDGTALTDHRMAIQEWVKNSNAQNLRPTYVGSWATHPAVRGDIVISRLCATLSVALVTLHCEAIGSSRVMTFANLRLKVDRLHRRSGWMPLDFSGVPLSEFKCPAFFDERLSVSVGDLKTLTKFLAEVVSDFRELWNARELLAPAAEIVKKAA